MNKTLVKLRYFPKHNENGEEIKHAYVEDYRKNEIRFYIGKKEIKLSPEEFNTLKEIMEELD